MPSIKFPAFISGDYTPSSKIISTTRSINLYPELVPEGGDGQIALLNTPGTSLFTQLSDSPGRGLWAGDGRLFAAAGGTLFEIFQDGTVNNLGSINQGGGPVPVTPVTMVSNGNQLFIVSGAQGYLANGVTIVPVVPAVMGTCLDGYFIAQQPNSNQFNLSGLQDGTTWPPLSFASKEGAPDRLQALIANAELLWLFGTETTEIWYDSGATNFPLQRYPGAFIEAGIIAPFSLVKLDNSLFWLGGDQRGAGIVYRTQGFTPLRVSNHAVEYAIQNYPNIQNAVASSYQQQGHLFYRLDFSPGGTFLGKPFLGATWVYDVSTNMWHERTYLSNGNHYAHRGRFHAYTFGKHFVQDYTNGNVYVQDLQAFSDNTAPGVFDPIRKVRRSPHVNQNKDWMQYGSLEVQMEVGTAPATGQGSNPQMIMRYSDDGGFTWSQEKIFSSFQIGNYLARVKWNRLGRSRDRVFEISCSDPIHIALIDAYLEAKQGTGN